MKKYRSKWFRVAVEGSTTDGRQIQRNWIEEMAANYNRAVYGARIWMEHLRGLFPESPLRAYGDVTALKAEEIDLAGEKRLALFAQIEPTDDLVHMVNVLKQKVYTSVEVTEKFAHTGKAYLLGLAVTDSPASLGTEMLAFARQNPAANPLSARKHAPDTLFTEATETALEFEEVESAPGVMDKLFAKLDALLTKALPPAPTPLPAPADKAAAPDELAATFAELKQALDAQFSALPALSQQVSELAAEVKTLAEQFNSLPDPAQPQRPLATGAGAPESTDC